MKRILVFGMTENPGGVENFLINYYRHIDREAVQFDFLCNTDQAVAYESELKRLGARVYHIVSRRQNRKMFRSQLTGLFDAHAKEWEAIWVNVCSLANIDYLKTAKAYGIKRRIIHSHNSGNMEGIIRRVLHEWNKLKVHRFATDYWACSEEAAEWFYTKTGGKRIVIIPNAIDTEHFQYDSGKREIIRSEYGLKDRFVIGNIGRLHFQKNQSFLIDVFAEYSKKNNDAYLLLVGGGADEDKLKNKVEKMGLAKCVAFAGVQHDIAAFLDSFDIFIFPSLFEGLGIAALEAQANGMPVLLSEGCPPDVVVNGNVSRLPLSAGTDAWCREIDLLRRQGRDNTSEIENRFRAHGFDIINEALRLEKLLTDERTIISDC